MTSAPGVNSSTLGSWPWEACLSISASVTTVTAAGASTMRSVRREAVTTVMVSAKATFQSTIFSTRAEEPALTSTPSSVATLSPNVKESE